MLPERVKEAYELKEKGFNAEKIAELMNISLNTAKFYLYLSNKERYLRYRECKKMKGPIKVRFQGFGNRGKIKSHSKIVEMLKRENLWLKVKVFNTREEFIAFLKDLIAKYSDWFKDSHERRRLTYWLRNHLLLTKEEINEIYNFIITFW